MIVQEPQKSPEQRSVDTDGIEVSVPLVRSWARLNGFSVAERGRIKPAVIAAYLEAHGDQ